MTKREKQMLLERNSKLLNHIKVSEKINTIAYSRYRYDYILSTSPVNIGLVEDMVVDLVDNDSLRVNEYLLCTIGERGHTMLSDFFYNFKIPKIIVYYLIESFSEILDSMILLNNANICWFDFTPDSIGFGNGYKPILRDFDNSILLGNDFSITLKEILKNVHVDDFIYKPIEVHLLYYLCMNKETNVTSEAIKNVKTNFAAMNRLEIASVGYIEKYIGYSMDDVIVDMKPNTWDSYIFCSMYIDLLRQIDHKMFPKNEIVTNFIIELTKCNQIDPEKRASLNELKECCYQVKRNCKKWGFVDYFL
jgi:hypothetical protein